jgi:hypothetical protein
MHIPQCAPFKVFEEAGRLNKTPLNRQKNFKDGKKLKNSRDTNGLQKALNCWKN